LIVLFLSLDTLRFKHLWKIVLWVVEGTTMFGDFMRTPTNTLLINNQLPMLPVSCVIYCTWRYRQRFILLVKWWEFINQFQVLQSTNNSLPFLILLERPKIDFKFPKFLCNLWILNSLNPWLKATYHVCQVVPMKEYDR
jgi:hypothetical protein